MRGTELTVGLAYRLGGGRDAARNQRLRLFDALLLARDGVRRKSEQVSAIVGTRIMCRLH
jgi:hypothetical protein